jgi:hypothetical protein
MAVNQLIARGVAPIGQDLPQIGNMLFQRDQAQQQNALAQMGMQADMTRANAFADQVLGQRENAEAARIREAMQQDFDNVAANPQLMPQYLGLLRSTVAPDLPDSVTLPEIALRFRLQAPKQPEAPAPVELGQVGGYSFLQQGGKPLPVSVMQPQRPGAASAPKEVNRQLVTRPTPDGRQQDFAFNPQTAQLEPVGPAYDKAAPLAPKDATVAKQKLTQIAIARQQLNNAKQKFASLQGTLSAGPGGGFLPTPSGRAFDAAIDGMRGTIAALTRVPGIGAMSDFETRLDQAKFPERGDYEDVIGQKLEQLDALVKGLDTGYRDLLGSANDVSAPPSGGNTSGAPKPGMVVDGWVFKGGDPANQANWKKK